MNYWNFQPSRANGIEVVKHSSEWAPKYLYTVTQEQNIVSAERNVPSAPLVSKCKSKTQHGLTVCRTKS